MITISVTSIDEINFFDLIRIEKRKEKLEREALTFIDFRDDK